MTTQQTIREDEDHGSSVASDSSSTYYRVHLHTESFIQYFNPSLRVPEVWGSTRLGTRKRHYVPWATPHVLIYLRRPARIFGHV